MRVTLIGPPPSPEAIGPCAAVTAASATAASAWFRSWRAWIAA